VFENVQDKQAFSTMFGGEDDGGIGAGELDMEESTLPKMVPPKPYPSSRRRFARPVSESESTISSDSPASCRSIMSFARICKDSTVAELSSSSLP
jgi:hypothetical protein